VKLPIDDDHTVFHYSRRRSFISGAQYMQYRFNCGMKEVSDRNFPYCTYIGCTLCSGILLYAVLDSAGSEIHLSPTGLASPLPTQIETSTVYK
jgi:hypothetical protein